MSHLSCPVCQHSSFRTWSSVKDHAITGETFALGDCTECGLRATLAPPPEATCGRYYKSESYVSHSNTRKGFIFRIYHIVRSYMLDRKASLIGQLGKGRSLLDVGCGTGYFADAMARKGYDVHGIEIDDDARTFAQQTFGLTVDPPSELLEGAFRKSFSHITLWHVMEHLYDPARYWKAFHNLLEEDGFLLVAVPNRQGFDARYYGTYWAGYDVPRHLWHFTPAPMVRMAELYGFELHSKKQLPFDPFYNSLLSGKYTSGLAIRFLWDAVIGTIAFLQGSFSVDKASSVIYIFRKKAAGHE